MSRKTHLSHNPSFDLDFIGQIMRTESSVRNLSYSSSLPKIDSRYISQELRQNSQQKIRTQKQHTAGNGDNFAKKHVKRGSKEEALLKRKIEIPHEVRHAMSVKRYGKWL